MIIYDFFAGTGSATKAFEDAGHTVIKIELDEYFEAHERDILQLDAQYLIDKYGKPDFIWASPPCTTFSVASLRWYWTKENGKAVPKNEKTLAGIRLVEHTVKLIQDLNPTIGWLMENPRGMLRKQDVVKDLPRQTVTYCQYGKSYMKPTDLWGYVPGWKPRPMCKPGAGCHEFSKRSSRSGLQGALIPGMKRTAVRAMVPHELSLEIMKAIHESSA